MKTIFLSGRLTSDPEISKIGDDKRLLAKFSIANNDAGSENAEFYEIVCWDRRAELAERHFHKGKKIVVQGTITDSVYTDGEGKKRHHIQIIADRFEFDTSSNIG